MGKPKRSSVFALGKLLRNIEEISALACDIDAEFPLKIEIIRNDPLPMHVRCNVMLEE
jgi:hypothetical protein